jgi:hypothetical protein
MAGVEPTAAEELRRCALHELESIAEGIENMDAAKAVEGSVGSYKQAGLLTGRQDFVEARDYQRWMSSLCGMKLGFNAEVQIYRPRYEPDSVAPRHGSGFLYFGEPENSGIEFSRTIFATDRDRNLHVIETKDWHRLQVPPARYRPIFYGR